MSTVNLRDAVRNLTTKLAGYIKAAAYTPVDFIRDPANIGMMLAYLASVFFGPYLYYLLPSTQSGYAIAQAGLALLIVPPVRRMVVGLTSVAAQSIRTQITFNSAAAAAAAVSAVAFGVYVYTGEAPSTLVLNMMNTAINSIRNVPGDIAKAVGESMAKAAVGLGWINAKADASAVLSYLEKLRFLLPGGNWLQQAKDTLGGDPGTWALAATLAGAVTNFFTNLPAQAAEFYRQGAEWMTTKVPEGVSLDGFEAAYATLVNTASKSLAVLAAGVSMAAAPVVSLIDSLWFSFIATGPSQIQMLRQQLAEISLFSTTGIREYRKIKAALDAALAEAAKRLAQLQEVFLQNAGVTKFSELTQTQQADYNNLTALAERGPGLVESVFTYLQTLRDAATLWITKTFEPVRSSMENLLGPYWTKVALIFGLCIAAIAAFFLFKKIYNLKFGTNKNVELPARQAFTVATNITAQTDVYIRTMYKVITETPKDIVSQNAKLADSVIKYITSAPPGLKDNFSNVVLALFQTVRNQTTPADVVIEYLKAINALSQQINERIESFMMLGDEVVTDKLAVLRSSLTVMYSCFSVVAKQVARR